LRLDLVLDEAADEIGVEVGPGREVGPLIQVSGVVLGVKVH